MITVKRLAAALLVGGCLTVTTMPSSARTNVCGTSVVWCVWVNYTNYPHTIGVANGIYGRSHPGWYKLAGVYANDRLAWNVVCRYHRMRKYHSPDIAQGRIRC